MDGQKSKLDEKIELSGFRDIDAATMAVVKKILHNHSNRILELCSNIETLHITLKQVHEREKSEKYEVHAKLIDNGKVFVSKVTERNLHVAIDSALNKIIHEIE